MLNRPASPAKDTCLSMYVVVRPGGALGEEVLLELLDLIAAGEVRPEDIRPKR